MDSLAKQIATPAPDTHTACAYCHEPIAQVGEYGDRLNHCFNCSVTEGETVELENE